MRYLALGCGAIDALAADLADAEATTQVMGLV
jgi:hypothetical protein